MKSRFAATAFAWCLGTFGINEFYTGHKSRGIADILISVLLSWTYVAPLVITILNLVRGCKYLWCDTDEQFNKEYVEGYKSEPTVLND